MTASGLWSQDEIQLHINILEMKAAFLALKSFAKDLRDKHILILADNKCTVAYIREMGGSHSLLCNDIARDMWEWAIARNLWLSASYLPGKMNLIADNKSRVFNVDTEWKLNPEVFSIVRSHFDEPINIDLFASYENHQLKPFVAWNSDPEAFHIDAFTLNWSKLDFWAFPPFSLLPRVLQKISQEKATGVVVLPHWCTQSWFPTAMKMLTASPLLLPHHPKLLQLPCQPSRTHPLFKSLDLLVCRLSGEPLQTKTFQANQQKLSFHRGENQHPNNIPVICGSGNTFVLRKALIPLSHVSGMF